MSNETDAKTYTCPNVVDIKTSTRSEHQVEYLEPCVDTDQIQRALGSWCEGLVKLSHHMEDNEKGDACREFVRSHYAFDDNIGPVLFKPTLAKGCARIRLDEEGAIAYFCGTGDEQRDADEGNGFAKKHWKRCTAQSKAIRIDGCTATVLGTLTVTDANSKQTTVDKTWTFVNPSPGPSRPLLQLVGHHSSLQV
jgi:hypothetical protein